MSPVGDYYKEPPVKHYTVSSFVAVFALSFAASGPARADARAESTSPGRGHGPQAPDDQFPSHVFQLDAHQPKRVQLGFTYGLVQPLVYHGFNAAVDVRYKRLVLTYSHGQGLDVTSGLSSSEKAAGMTANETFTTGGGVGVVLIDELWVLADFKVHQFQANTALDHQTYTNVTIGGEMRVRGRPIHGGGLRAPREQLPYCLQQSLVVRSDDGAVATCAERVRGLASDRTMPRKRTARDVERQGLRRAH
jgi:hypothetical protein